MDTSFIVKAHSWTQKSIDSINEKKYLSAWIYTIPARLCYLADVITTIASSPFTFIKLLFSSIEAMYTWGKETKNLSIAISDLFNVGNNIVSSLVGIFFTSYAKSIRDKNNLKPLLSAALFATTIAVAVLAIFKADGLELYYNFKDGSLEPYFYWDFSKKEHPYH